MAASTTSSGSPPPHVVIVGGSWQEPAHYAVLRNALDSAGVSSSCPQHPSFNGTPETSMTEDAQNIHKELKSLIEVEEKEVVVICHSYGGVVTTEAVDHDFAKKVRRSKGLKGGVVGILYMCAFVLPANNSLQDAFDGNLPPFLIPDGNGMYSIPDARRVIYNDMSPEEQDHYYDLLRPIPALTVTTPTTQLAYTFHPSAYLFCEDDQAIPLSIQKMMVENAEAATGVQFLKDSCSAGHSPFISMPERVVETYWKIVSREEAV